MHALLVRTITTVIANQPTVLQIALGVLMREKSLIEHGYKFRIICSYDEVLKFKASAASGGVKQNSLHGILDFDGALGQAVADNFDANISLQNGLLSTHALAILQSHLRSMLSVPSSKQPFGKQL